MADKGPGKGLNRIDDSESQQPQSEESCGRRLLVYNHDGDSSSMDISAVQTMTVGWCTAVALCSTRDDLDKINLGEKNIFQHCAFVADIDLH